MTTHLRKQIAESLRGRILAGELPAGSRIKEEALAKDFEVSRGPIRDVFIALSKEGFIEAVPNKGATVCHMPTPSARKILVRSRREIEVLCLRSGYPSWDEEFWKKLSRTLRHLKSAAEDEDLADVIKHDMEFHSLIVSKNPNENLMCVWQPLVTTMSLPYSRHEKLTESYEEHRRIIESLKKGELNDAVELLKKNIQ